MSDNFRKLISSTLCLALLLTTALISLLSASAESILDNSNILSGLTPVTYTSVNSGTTVYNETPVRYVQNSDEYRATGYDLPNNIENEAKGYWDPILCKLTDGNIDTGFFIQADRYWEHDDVLAVYQVESSNIKGFTLRTDNPDFGKNIKVYASNDYADLFNSQIATVSSRDEIVTYKLQAAAVKYIAFVFVDPDFQAQELTVYGEAVAANKIENQLPVAYGSTAANGTAVNWNGVWVRKIVAGNAEPIKDVGFDTFNNVQPTAREAWYQYYLNPINDGDLSTSQLIKPEYCYDDVYHDVLMIFELSDIDLEGFLLSTNAAGVQKNIKVYAARNYAELFDNQIAEIITTNKVTTCNLDTVASKYVAFRFIKADFEMQEIEVYGKATAASADMFAGLTNLVSGVKPVVFGSTAANGTAVNWNNVWVRNIVAGNTEPNMDVGFDTFNNVQPHARDAWYQYYLNPINDGDLSTSQLIKPEYCYDDVYHDMIMAFETDEVDLKGFKLSTADANVKKL